MQPRIGITCNIAGYENRLSVAYVRAVSLAGGTPYLLPVTVSPPQWEEMLRSIDGLVLSGGGDPDACHFGEEAAPAQGQVQPRRDRMELFLARKALQENLPVLGICRGAQVLNIAAGGTLHQDLAGVARVQHDQKAPRNYPIHRVHIERPSLLFRIIRREAVRVNSFHHQAVKRPGAGLWVCARAGDGVAEAVEFPAHRFALGVQWHPEWLTPGYSHAGRLFTALCRAAAKKAKGS